MAKLTYNEFRKKYAEKGYGVGFLSRDWALYKEGKFTFTGLKKSLKEELPAEIKAMNKKLTEKNKYLQELREKKRAGKDVKEEITKTSKYLNENREKKKERMRELGLM